MTAIRSDGRVVKTKLKNSTSRGTKHERKAKNAVTYSYVQATLTVITGLYPHNTLKSEGTCLFCKSGLLSNLCRKLKSRCCVVKSDLKQMQ